jgi:hypothetical protein
MGSRRYMMLFLVLMMGATACGSSGSPPSTAGAVGSCASVAYFDGREYSGHRAVVHPVPGEVLGEARLPGCNDTGEPTAPPDEFVEVARLSGVDPEIAMVVATTPEVIYVRSDLDPLPDEVVEFFAAPPCEPTDGPIELEGQWLSILGPNGTTEVDLVPPYTVGMLVAHSSSPRYLMAEIEVEVLPSLGSPLTREDLSSSLWEGGTVQVETRCDGERFIAESIEAFPPQ